MQWEGDQNGCQSCQTEIADMINCNLCQLQYCYECFNNKHFFQHCSFCSQPQYCVIVTGKFTQKVPFKCRSCYLSQRKTEEGKK
jgi:hypothetical protein